MNAQSTFLQSLLLSSYGYSEGENQRPPRRETWQINNTRDDPGVDGYTFQQSSTPRNIANLHLPETQTLHPESKP